MSEYEKALKQLENSGKLFEDGDFPATTISLTSKRQEVAEMQWKRPHEIVESPVFINKGATHYDLNQGRLGNCWFLAGAATLAANNKALLEKVVPIDQTFDKVQGYKGIFRFNFWRYGDWLEVVVDDRLPTEDGQLIYGHNTEEPSEFWCALLEKAYAKLHGSYEAIEGGRVHDGLVDMTGGISELVPLQDTKLNPDTFYENLKKMSSMQTLIGAAIFNQGSTASREVRMENGLYQGHAYSITGLKEVKVGNKPHKLLRARNPWGKGEWNGGWSDGSTEMEALDQSEKEQLGLNMVNDGEFWINIEDFIQNFDEVELCHLYPDSLTDEVAEDTDKKQWEVKTSEDSWIRGISAGGCGNTPYEALYWKNPQFHLGLEEGEESSTVIVSLMEIEYDRQRDLWIGFDIYKLNESAPAESLGEKYKEHALTSYNSSGQHSPYREVTVRFELEPGRYVIVPCTFEAFKEADFLLRIFTEKPSDFEPIEDEDEPVVEDEFEENKVEDPISTLHDKHAGVDGLVDAFGLREMFSDLLKRTTDMTEGISLETTRVLLAGMDVKMRGVVDFPTVRTMWEQVNLWKSSFHAFDADKSGTIDTHELKNAFKNIGFVVSRPVLRIIARRYGDRKGHLRFEDFLLCSSRLLSAYRAFRKQTSNKTERRWRRGGRDKERKRRKRRDSSDDDGSDDDDEKMRRRKDKNKDADGKRRRRKRGDNNDDRDNITEASFTLQEWLVTTLNI